MLSFKALTPVSSERNLSSDNRKMMLLYPKILCLTDVFSVVLLMQLWLFHLVLILINFLEQIIKSMILKPSNKSVPRLLRNFSLAMLKHLNLQPENRILIFKQTNLSQNLLTKLQCMKSPVKQTLISHQLKHHGLCHKFEAFQKRLWLKITNFSYLRMKLNLSYQFYVVKHLNKLEWKSLKKRSLLRWKESRLNLKILINLKMLISND